MRRMNLVEAIKKEQVQRSLNDSELARLLEIDLSTWSRIKNGERPPGGKFLKAIMRRLPEIGLVVIDYMRESDTDEISKCDEVATDAAK